MKPFAFAFAFAFALAFAGCRGCARTEKPTPCAAGLKSELEVRDASGALELAVKNGEPNELDLCDPQSRRIGRVVTREGALTLLDESGQVSARIVRVSPNDLTAVGASGPIARLHLSPEQDRLLKPDGVPLGSVAPTDGGATLYNPASAPVGTVTPRGSGQVLVGADGATRLYVQPASPAAAGLLGVEGVDLPIRVLLLLSSKSR
jgi:hypothetical protein